MLPPTWNLPKKRKKSHLPKPKWNPRTRKMILFPFPKQIHVRKIWFFTNFFFISFFTVWPRTTRTRLFLPFFALPCLHQSHSIPENNAILGKGRFGIVYGLDKPSKSCKKCFIAGDVDGNLAIKKLRKSLVVSEQAVIQIIQEIRIHSVCSGLPYVLPFLKAWQNERNLYVAVPLCNRGSLADLFKARKAAFSSQSVLIAANQIYTGKS